MDWAYVAGFFDGEGCVVKRKRKSGLIDYYIFFTNTNFEVLQKIKDFLNAGNIRQAKHRPNELGKKPYYYYYIYRHQDVERIAKELIKYCIVKKDKLNELILFEKNRQWFNERIPVAKLHELYCEKKLSYPQIAKILNVHPKSVGRKLKKLNIPRRNSCEAMILSLGSGETTRNTS